MAVSIAIAIFLLLHGFAIASSGFLWGVDSLAYYPPWFAGGVAILALPLLVPAVRRRLATLLARADAGPGSRRNLLVVAYVLILGSSLAWRFPSAIDLLGDGRLHIGDLERAALAGEGIRVLSWANDNAPLSYRSLHAMHELVTARGGGAHDTFRVVDLIAWIVWVLLTGLAARAFGRQAGRIPVFLFLLSGGFLQLFFGYAEIYAPLFPLTLAVLLAARWERRASRPPLVSGVLLGLAVSFHLALVTLAPVVFLAGFSKHRRVQGATRGAAGLVLGAGVAIVLMQWAGFDVLGYLRADRAANFLTVFAEPTFRHAYRLFSPLHFVDLANEALLVAPAAILALPFVRGVDRSDPDVRLLAVACIGPLLFAFLANPEVGAFRDWDALSFGAVPVLLLAAVALSRGERARAMDVTVAVTVAAFVHTALWIGVNADSERARERFAERLSTSPTSRHARAYGWETLGSHYRGLDQTRDAADAYDRAIENSPDNPRLWALAAHLRGKIGDLDESERLFRKSLAIDANHAAGLVGLGTLLAKRGAWPESVALLERGLREDPLNSPVWFVLGLGYRDADQSERALGAFRRALEVQPSNAIAWLEAGRMELILGRTQPAREALNRFLELRPTGPEADNVRGVLGKLSTDP